jgi:hypothetical protein
MHMSRRPSIASPRLAQVKLKAAFLENVLWKPVADFSLSPALHEKLLVLLIKLLILFSYLPVNQRNL